MEFFALREFDNRFSIICEKRLPSGSVLVYEHNHWNGLLKIDAENVLHLYYIRSFRADLNSPDWSIIDIKSKKQLVKNN